MKAIEIKDLNYYFKSDWTFLKSQGLKNITLDVEEGESFGFLGQNGAGKTTTIKCLLGLLRPQSGELKIFGEDSKLASSRKLVGYVPEQPYFYDNLKVIESIKMYAGLSGVSNKDINRLCSKALERAKIEHKANALMRSLSKGQTQRLAIAQAIVHEPKLLVLDEPFSGLDPIGRKQISDLLFELKTAGTTIFICSHILSDIEFLCDRASIMAKGQILGIYDLKDLPRLDGGTYEIVISNFDSIKEFVNDSAVLHQKFLTVSYDNLDDAKNLIRKIIDSPAHLESFSFNGGNLEDLFIKLVERNS